MPAGYEAEVQEVQSALKDVRMEIAPAIYVPPEMTGRISI